MGCGCCKKKKPEDKYIDSGYVARDEAEIDEELKVMAYNKAFDTVEQMVPESYKSYFQVARNLVMDRNQLIKEHILKIAEPHIPEEHKEKFDLAMKLSFNLNAV